jgi:dihydrodipicolinate synthase/N-acetylneuraminate lyase
MSVPSTDPIITVPMVTPFDDEDRLDLKAAERNMARWLKTPLSGFLVGSQSGEEAHLSEVEKLELARVVHETLSGDRFLIGGIDCPSVTETLHRAESFAEVGAEMVRVRFPRQPSVVLPYFDQVLPRCPVPVLLMHQCEPASFGVAASPAAAPEVLGQVSQMDNVFGYVTDHDMRFEARVRRHVPASRRFWICNGSMILSGTLIGCNGTTTAFSNIWPESLKRLLDHGMAGRYEAAQELQERVRLIDEIMLPHLAAGIKVALSLLGFDGMVPRRPTPSMPEGDVHRLENAMRSAGILDR